jgi:hypothetical protein
VATIQFTRRITPVVSARIPSFMQSYRRSIWRSVVLILAATGLAGCETGSNALSGAQPETSLVQNVAPAAAQPLTKVAIAPIIGAPDQVGRQLQQDVSAALAKQKASVVPVGERADFTLRGYVVAAKDKANTKVSYIWDVTDLAGKRVNRITGDEIIPGQTPKEPWTAVTPTVTQAIAQKSAVSFGAWLPTAPSQAAVANSQPVGVGAAGGVASVQTASAPGIVGTQPKPQAAVQTASAPSGANSTALVPSVVGAPGDGATSLTRALQDELTKNGVPLASQQTAAAYRVEGVVKVGASRDGKQPIQIDWNVKDPQGKKLGTVSQKNEIPDGSLDGAWGPTANAAAAAAAQGILKLLPQRQ